MSKANKISLTEATITENNGMFTIIGNTKKEANVTINLNDELKNFVDMDNLEFKLVQKKDRKSSDRKPTYKFVCSKCGKIVKSSDDNINLQCLDCNEKLEISDK
jgi:DNA-directed RNA polymerase subunit RPC12/RpoP